MSSQKSTIVFCDLGPTVACLRFVIRHALFEDFCFKAPIITATTESRQRKPNRQLQCSSTVDNCREYTSFALIYGSRTLITTLSLHWQATRWFGDASPGPWCVGRKFLIKSPSFLPLLGKEYFVRGSILIFSNRQALSTFAPEPNVWGWVGTVALKDRSEEANADGSLEVVGADTDIGICKHTSSFASFTSYLWRGRVFVVDS